MSETHDLDLHRVAVADDLGTPHMSGGAPEDFDRSDGAKWIVLVIVFVIAASLIGYVIWRQRNAVRAAPPVAAATTPAPAAVTEAPKTGPLVEAEKIPLPPLGETDALVRQLVVKLTAHPAALAWLATNGLIENFAVVTLNVSEGQAPVVHLPTLAPRTRFSVLKTDRGLIVDPKSYGRYDGFAAAVSGLDPAGTARLYLTVKPRITEAYRNLGYPEGDFDRVLERAITLMVSTPAVDANAGLREKVLSYQFTDPDIESLSAAQKQLLRMGPDNMRRVQDKLREIATQLGLHP